MREKIKILEYKPETLFYSLYLLAGRINRFAVYGFYKGIAGIFNFASGYLFKHGCTTTQTFFKVILPQVIKRALPSITNEIITLVKDTSLAFAIGVTEMFTISKQLASRETNMLPYLAAGVFYYIFNYLVAFIMERIEKKLAYYKN